MVTDKSPKGSYDERAMPIIEMINEMEKYATTSSCSGRAALYAAATKWIFVSHDPISGNLGEHFDFGEHIHDEKQPLVNFVFEPFILHVQCADHEAAHKLLSIAYNTGYRNSGLLPSKKHMVAIRSTLRLEAPVGYYDVETGKINAIVRKQYVQTLVDIANDKFRQNFERMEKLLTNMRNGLTGVSK